MNYIKNEILLSAENVNLSYDKQILRDVNFQIQNITRPDRQTQGQVVSLIGRSGIGKTQLFKIMAGLQKPSSGAVKIGADQHPVRAGEVGIVPQNYILFNHRTVQQNLEIAQRQSGEKMDSKQKESLLIHAENFHLREHLKKYPMQLSGGQRQRVSILQQILAGNRFILFDEPFSGLDVLMIDRVVELLLKVSCMHDHSTLIIVSHDVENAMAISDTVYILARQEGKEGATITETLDLLHMGMAWNPEIKKDARFQELVYQIKHKI